MGTGQVKPLLLLMVCSFIQSWQYQHGKEPHNSIKKPIWLLLTVATREAWNQTKGGTVSTILITYESGLRFFETNRASFQENMLWTSYPTHDTPNSQYFDFCPVCYSEAHSNGYLDKNQQLTFYPLQSRFLQYALEDWKSIQGTEWDNSLLANLTLRYTSSFSQTQNQHARGNELNAVTG